MIFTFCRYFFQYVFRAKTKQRLLFLAILGLLLSSFALLVLQSTMGGLQENLITRSKKATGSYVIELSDKSQKFAEKIAQSFTKENTPAYPEFELELLLRYKDFISPVVVHGIDFKNKNIPAYLKKADGSRELSIGQDLAYKMDLGPGDKLRLISPAHVDSLMGDIPRVATVYLNHIAATSVPEVDLYHAWVDIKIINNLTRAREYNRVRVFGNPTDKFLDSLKKEYGKKIKIISWEETNRTLVWALGLETTTMVFLFCAMTLLVSLCITSGLMLFFDRIRNDLASFWILGTSKAQIEGASTVLVQVMGVGSIICGIILGYGFLIMLDSYGPNIMPDIFLDRKMPVNITLKGVAIAALVPYVISTVFSIATLRQFKKDNNHLDQVRSFGG